MQIKLIFKKLNSASIIGIDIVKFLLVKDTDIVKLLLVKDTDIVKLLLLKDTDIVNLLFVKDIDIVKLFSENTLNIFFCSILNNWIGHKFHNLEMSSPIHT